MNSKFLQPEEKEPKIDIRPGFLPQTENETVEKEEYTEEELPTFIREDE